MPKIKTSLILIILFLLPIYLIKIKFGWASLNALELLVSLLLVVWAFDKENKYLLPARDASRNDAGGLSTQYSLPVILIFAGLLLALIVNKNYYIGLGAIKGWFLFPIIFGTIFYDALKKDDSLLDKSFPTLFFSGIFLSIVGICHRFSGLLTYDGRLRIFFDSPNQLGMFLAPIFIAGLILFVREKNISRKMIFLSGLILVAVNLFFTYSYGTWGALIITLAALYWLKYRSFRRRIGILIFILAAAVIIGQTKSEKLKGLTDFSGRSSLDSRIMIWKSAGRMVKDNSFFGIGPGNFQNKYLEYQKYFPPYLEWAVPQPHNLFLAFWLETGFVGLVGFVLLMMQFFKDNKKAIQRDREMAFVCLGIMVYFLIHGLVDTTYWRNDMAMLFWAVIAINLFIAGKKKEAFQ